MYTLPVKELKQFFAASAFIPQSNVLPILSYMRISMNEDGASLYRTNLEAYYIQSIDVQNKIGEVVVEYTALANFVSQIKSDSVTLTPKDKTVIISDGQTKITSTIMDGAVFPIVPKINTEGTLLTEEIIFTLKRASKFLNDDPTPGLTTHVFVGKNYICASDRNIAHYAPIDTPIEGAFYKTIINALPGACNFSVSENYFTFTTLTATYLFTKPEVNFFDMTKVAGSRPANVTCKLSKDEFVSYLTIAKGQCKYKICVVEILGEGKSTIKLVMNDPMYNVTVDRKIEVDGTPLSFKFNADYMLTLCKQFSGETLSLYEDGSKLYIHDENNNFLTIIMKVI